MARRRSEGERAWTAIGLVVLGAAAGAGIAFLLTPCSGRELRSRIAQRVDDVSRNTWQDDEESYQSSEERSPTAVS